MEKIILLSISPRASWLERSVFFLKRFIRQCFVLGGPLAVEQSITRGLQELGVSYMLNPSEHSVPRNSNVFVLSNNQALMWAVQAKQDSLVRRIIAGPNIVVTPHEYNGSLKNPAIDAVLVPSQWVKDFFVHEAPSLANKIFIWPAGTALVAAAEYKKDIDFLVYNKIGKSPLLEQIIDFLAAHRMSFKVLTYGKFRRRSYFELLKRSRAVIYLSNSESQGIALLEAWARNVPTLAWERGVWQYGPYSWKGMTSTPYVTPEVGSRFTTIQEFCNSAPQIFGKHLKPLEVVEKNFSYSASAKILLSIINTLP